MKHSLWEYVRGDVQTNTIESLFSRLNREMHGTHHAVSRKHPHRYVAEVAIKHNTRRIEGGEPPIQGGEGKKLRRC